MSSSPPDSPASAASDRENNKNLDDQQEDYDDRGDYSYPDNAGGGGGGDGSGPSIVSSRSSVGLENPADALPPFASAEVRMLDAQVKAKEKYLHDQLYELEENEERVRIMAEHLKNVEKEAASTELLIKERQKEEKTEEHLKALAERESGRIESEMRKIQSQFNEIIDYYNNLSNQKFLVSEKISHYKNTIEWNQEELLQWSLAAKQKENDSNQLEYYHLQDNKAIKTLTFQYEQLSRKLQEKKFSLQKEITETQAIQIELEKTADYYKTIHLEKQSLIKQWNECKEMLYEKDNSITALSEEILLNKGIIKDLQEKAIETGDILKREQLNHRQISNEITLQERKNEKSRLELYSSKQELLNYEDSIQNLKIQYEKAEYELKSYHSQLEELQRLKGEKSKQFESIQNSYESIRLSLEKEKETTKSLSDRNQQLEELYKSNQQQFNYINQEIQRLKDNLFKSSQALFQDRNEEANLLAEITGAQGKSRNSQERIHKLDQESLKQQEMLYNIEFQVQQLERKVSHANGKRSIEDLAHLNHQIEKLEKELEIQSKQSQLINQQLKHLQDELRGQKRQYQGIIEKKSQIIEEIHALEMENDSYEREIKGNQSEKANLIVSHDLLKLEVKKLRETLNNRADAVLQQEQRKYSLQLAWKEREKELSLAEEIKRAEIKALDEGRHNMIRELKDRQNRVEKLKKKYESVAGKLSNGPGADDEEFSPDHHSQAYYIIKAGQEREELQRIGDKLNQEIKAAEKEIHALQNTQALLQARNSSYKAGLQRIDPNSSENQEKLALEEQQRSTIDKLYKQRAYLREILKDFEERRGFLTNLINSIGQSQQEIHMRQSEIAALEKGFQDQLAALGRSERVRNGKIKEYRKFYGYSPLVNERDIQEYELNYSLQSDEELYMKIQEKKRRNRVILQLLQEFILQNPSIGGSVENSLQELGIQLPAEDNRPDSAASSVSSVQSGMSSRSSNTGYASYQRALNEEKQKEGSRPTSSGSSVLPPITGANSRPSSRPSSRPVSNSSNRSTRDRPQSGIRTTGVDLSVDSRRK